MKIKIKKTGEICNIASWAKVALEYCDSYGNPIELDFDEVEFCVEPSINWEQRRYEITKAALQGFLTHDSPFEYDVGVVLLQVTLFISSVLINISL